MSTLDFLASLLKMISALAVVLGVMLAVIVALVGVIVADPFLFNWENVLRTRRSWRRGASTRRSACRCRRAPKLLCTRRGTAILLGTG